MKSGRIVLKNTKVDIIGKCRGDTYMNIVITGAGRGLGLEMVKKHIGLGDRVFALAHSVTPELEDICKSLEIEAEGSSRLEVQTVELTDYNSVIKLAEGYNGDIDILYNIAGIYYEDQRCDLEDTDIAKAMRMYEINALAPLNVMKAFEKHLIKGSINLIVSSEAGSIGASWRSSEYGYCMSKAAVNMAAKNFSNATSERGIQTILYHPGWMRTQMGGDRAKASSESIEASESADSLIKIVIEARKDALIDKLDKSVPFLDYQGNRWDW